jgi:hypothetical protein
MHPKKYVTKIVFFSCSMVLSRAAVRSYVESEHRCPSNDTPDDMFLGSVAAALRWDIVHSPLFHQVCYLTLRIAVNINWCSLN